MVDDEINKTP